MSEVRFGLKEAPSTYAINYFLSHYTGTVYLDYVPGFYRSGHCSQSLQASVEAVALACLANKRKSSDLLVYAREKYGIALKGTNAALQSLRTATTDETLASVMLLAFFAALLSDPQEAQETWSRHIDGALALLLLCRPEQFQSEIGQNLFHHIISCVQIDCLHRCKTFPARLNDLYSVSLIPALEFQRRFWALIDRVAVLRTTTEGYSSTVDMLDIINQSKPLDKDVLSLMQSMPMTHQYKVIKIIPNNGYPSDGIANQLPFHSYAASRVAQAWNTLRMLRLWINNTIFSHAAKYLELQTEISIDVQLDLRTHMFHAQHTAVAMSMDICASVPEFLRPDRPRQQSSMDRHNHDDKNSAAWAHSLTWPLSAASESPHTTEELRQYIDRQQRSLEMITGLGLKRTLSASTSLAPSHTLERANW
jgi:hypothetical protein